MKRLVPLLAIALAGCKTTGVPEPEVREVLVPTRVACVDPEDIPAEPPRVGQRFNGDAKHDLEILAPSAQALRKWGQDLRALLEACVTEQPDADEEAEAPDQMPGA